MYGCSYFLEQNFARLSNPALAGTYLPLHGAQSSCLVGLAVYHTLPTFLHDNKT